MILEHNSHSLFSRTPFGAAVCGEKIRLRLTLGECGWPESVVLKYNYKDTFGEVRMHFHSLHCSLSVYEAYITAPEIPCLVFYHFEVKDSEGNISFYGNNPERRGGVGTVYENNPVPYQITVYDKCYTTPEWFKDGVMYQIFPDRFYKSENYDGLSKSKNIIKRNWGETPYHTAEQFGGQYLANDCFGGSLVGIIEKLDYLKDLGIDIIYLNPIFLASSNHKYNTADYSKIDPLFGDEKIFKNLCKKAEEKGIRIVLDGVFNHTGSDSIYFNKEANFDSVGAYQSPSSPYYDWYNFSNYPDEYECWWGIKTLPHVNENSASYQEYILTGKDAIVKKWLRLGASGWRLDVVDELPDFFVKLLRKEVKKEKADAVIIGEVWEDASNKTAYGELREYLGGYELDSAMNYPVRGAIIAFSRGEISAKDFNVILMSLKENYPKPAFYAMMNFLSSHDTQRIITHLSDLPDGSSISREEQNAISLTDNMRADALKRLNIAISLLFTLPGVPSIFYGDEVGVSSYGDPFCRSCYPWDSYKDEDTFNKYKSLIALRKSSEAFVSGDIEFVYGEGSATGFLRYSDDECYLCIFNSSADYSWHLSLELGRHRICALKNISSDECYSCDFGRFCVELPAQTCKIFKCEVVK